MTPSPAIEAFLKTIPLFSLVEPPEIMDILRLLRQVNLEQGETLFTQGEPGNAMWVLGAGCEVTLSMRPAGGEDVELATLGEGETIGEMALIDDAGRSATATVTSAGVAHRIEAVDFEVLRGAHNPAAFKVMRKMSSDMCQRLRQISVRIVSSDGMGRPPDNKVGNFADGTKVEGAQLDAFPGFARLQATVRLALASKLREKRFPKGTVLVRHGDPGDSAFMLVEGEVAVQRRARTLAHLPAGSLFGLISAVDGGSRSASCVALTDVRVWRLDDKDFDWLFQSGNRFAYQMVDNVARELVSRLRQANATLVGMSSEPEAETAEEEVVIAENAANALTDADFEISLELDE